MIFDMEVKMESLCTLIITITIKTIALIVARLWKKHRKMRCLRKPKKRKVNVKIRIEITVKW